MKRHAVLIANDTFPFSESTLRPLRTVSEDLDGMKRIFTDLRGEFDEVVEIVNEGTEKIRRMIRSALGRVEDDDLVVIYYAGHGRVVSEPGFDDSLLLATYQSRSQPDADTRDLEYAWLENLLHRARIRRGLILLDCCYSGLADVELRSETDPALPLADADYNTVPLATIASGGDTQASVSGEGIYVFCACSPSEQARGSKKTGHGEFTRHFLDSLKSARDDSDDPITVEDVFRRVGYAMKDSKQTPSLSRRGGAGPLVLARAGIAGRKPKADAHRLEADRIRHHDAFGLDVSRLHLGCWLSLRAVERNLRRRDRESNRSRPWLSRNGVHRQTLQQGSGLRTLRPCVPDA